MDEKRERVFKFWLKIVFAHIAAAVCLVALATPIVLAAKHLHWWPFAQ